jgi:hypothetical protein
MVNMMRGKLTPICKVDQMSIGIDRLWWEEAFGAQSFRCPRLIGLVDDNLDVLDSSLVTLCFSESSEGSCGRTNWQSLPP